MPQPAGAPPTEVAQAARPAVCWQPRLLWEPGADANGGWRLLAAPQAGSPWKRMEEGVDGAGTPERAEPSGPGAEAPREEGQGADLRLKGTGSPSQGASKEVQGPAEETQGEEVAAQAAQQESPSGGTGRPLGPPEPSAEATAKDVPATETAAKTSLEEGKGPRIPAQEDQASQEKLGATPEKGHKPGVQDDKEQGAQTGLEKGQERSQPAEAGVSAQAEEAGRPQSREKVASQEGAGRSPRDLVPLQAASGTSKESGGSLAPKAGRAEGSQEAGLALGQQELLSDDKGAGQETGASTAREEAGPPEMPPSLEEASVVSSALPGMALEENDRPLSAHPLGLSWVFGYNSKLPVFNLLDEDFRVILYVSAHTAVIHDVLRNRQYLLQGHTSCISCICLSEDRRWVATADRGPESLLIVWDSYSAVPVHTIFDSHPEGGVATIAISHDSKFLATIGAGEVQKVCVWRWTLPETSPLCSVEIPPQFGFQDYLAFSSRDHKELISNSGTQVIFYLWDSNILNYHAPLLTEKTFNKAVGIFSQSLFHFSTEQAITGTLDGKIVVWDAVCPPPSKASAACLKPYNMKAIKVMSLQKEGITVLAITDRCFVTCDDRGHVKFYNGDLQLLHWYSQFRVGPIRSISFSRQPACPADVSQYPTSCTLSGHPFVARNFLLATSDALVIHVKPEGMKISKCLEEPREAVHALACHPSKPLMAKGSSCGLLKVWSYTLNKYLVSRIFKGGSVRSLCYNHDGSLLAAGFRDGSVYILDSISLEDECPESFQYSRGPVTHMSFSHDSQYLATADENLAVNLYKKVLAGEQHVWERLAGLHAHYKPIRSILFGVHLDSDEPRLLSLGEDRLLVEYDLEHSAKGELAIIRRDRVEQSAVPKCIAWYPPLTTEYFFLTANDHYKMKLYNVTTKLCRKTVLGPTYGSPLEQILVLPVAEGDEPQRRYLAYITKDKVGLQILPIDGNPHRSSAFVCHPAGVSRLAHSYDGRHLFTAGGGDFTVMKWDINVDALEASVFLGGEELTPFYNLLEGGRAGEFFRELEDYFYYAQLCHQGIDTMEPRKVSTHIPLEQAPFVMRAMGFYPSEEQIENMLNEVKFSEYLETGKQVTHINLGDFIKLYVNHRPAFGLAAKEIRNAFQVLGYENQDGEPAIRRGDLLLLLQHRGEHFTEDELAEYLTTLLGLNPEGGQPEAGAYDPAGADAFIEKEIPEEITATLFTADILDLPIPEPPLTEAETTNEPMSSVQSPKS
ncbi:cilia- and flagella-associated protein 251 [Elgaria multicarinata webbii]|uniref:cilia- and flagella-associated protein 251 n=1 Tax=Elgaria multicarinata webbii TaxID=159646 RepID=UPI002FCD1EA6